MELKYFAKGSTTLNFGYVQFTPEGYNGTDKLPVIIFHHGVGEGGNGSEAALQNILRIGLPLNIKNGLQLNAIVICIQHSTGWVTVEETKLIIDYVRAFTNVDLDRIYVTGLSAGSTAVFKYLFYCPELITAAWAVAIRSSGTPNNKKCEGFPVLIVSNEGDSPSELTGMLSALDGAKVNLKTDIGPGAAHNSWDRAYSTQGNFDWLFSHNKKNILPATLPLFVDISLVFGPLVIALENAATQLKKLQDRGKIYTRK